MNSGGRSVSADLPPFTPDQVLAVMAGYTMAHSASGIADDAHRVTHPGEYAPLGRIRGALAELVRRGDVVKCNAVAGDPRWAALVPADAVRLGRNRDYYATAALARDIVARAEAAERTRAEAQELATRVNLGWFGRCPVAEQIDRPFVAEVRQSTTAPSGAWVMFRVTPGEARWLWDQLAARDGAEGPAA